MALNASGTLKLNSGTSSEDIHLEVEGTTSGTYSLVNASDNADPSVGTLPTSMSDFYSHSQSNAPAAPSGLTASWDTGGCDMTVDWTDNSDNEDNFRLERNESGAGWTFVTSPAANATQYIDGAVTEEKSVIYRIRAENGDGDSAWSASSAAEFSTAC